MKREEEKESGLKNLLKNLVMRIKMLLINKIVNSESRLCSSTNFTFTPQILELGAHLAGVVNFL